MSHSKIKRARWLSSQVESTQWIFFQGDYDTRTNVVFNRPDVEGFEYVYEDTLTKAVLATRIVDYKNS